MARKQTKKTVRPPKPKPAEFRFWIDAYSPATIPMVRLAEYMVQLATMLGEPASVHFVKLQGGSTSIVHKVQPEAVPKVRERAQAVRRGDAPRDALRAYETVNRMLREDNGTGALKEESDAVIIPFPGRKSDEEKYTSIRQYGAIDGEVLRVGGPHKWVPVLMQAEDGLFSGCWADRLLAKQLAQHLFEPVRLHGRGKWNRDGDGKWRLQEFVIDRFDVLKAEPLSEAVARIRAIGAFKNVTLEDLNYVRYGPPESKNGGA